MGSGIVPKSKSGTLEANVGGHKGRTTRGATTQSYVNQGGKAAAPGAVKKTASKSDYGEALPWNQKKQRQEAEQAEQETALLVEDVLSNEEDDRNLFINPRAVFKKRFSWTVWRKNMYVLISMYFLFKASALPENFLK